MRPVASSHARVDRGGDRGSDGRDALAVHEHVGSREGRGRAGEDLAAAKDERHHFLSGNRSFV